MSFPFRLDVEVVSPANFIKWSQGEDIIDFLEFIDVLEDSQNFIDILIYFVD